MKHATTTTPDNDPLAAYAAHRADIARLLDVLDQQLAAHAPATVDRDWGKVGDLAKARADLVNLVAFMGSMDPGAVEAFLAD